MRLNGDDLQMNPSLVICLVCVIATQVNGQDNRVHYKTLPTEHNGVVERQDITQLAKDLFHKFNGLEDELIVFCSNDKRLVDASHKWYCQISPMHAVLYENGKAAPYAPDENQWTMKINLKNNSYELQKNWQQ